MPGLPDRLLRGRLTCPNRTGGICRGLAPRHGWRERPRPTRPRAPCQTSSAARARRRAGLRELSQGSRQQTASEAPGGVPLPQPRRGRLIHLSMGRAHRRALVTEFSVNAQRHQKGSVWLGKG